MKHKIFILGPQGSGKGTQAKILSEKLNIPALSMGNLLRDEVASESELGTQIAAIINVGDLVPDEMALEILKKRFSQPDAENGYILDGYPRNKEQYEALKNIDEPTALLVITVPKEESLKRMLKRAELEARVDDTPEVIEKRLEIYEQETRPIIELFEADGIVKYIDGVGTVEEIAERVESALNI